MLKANEKVRKLNIETGSTLTLCLIIDGVAILARGTLGHIFTPLQET